MSNQWDPRKIEADLKWLQKYPWFNEKPASIVEFLGSDYLNVERNIRPGVRAELVKIFGEDVNPHRIALVRWAMFTGAIGIGKTTMASIVIPYMAHWALCLSNPHDFYDLIPGSKIAFMQMSTSEEQAVETVFGDIKARIEYSPWFENNYPFDPKFTKQIRFHQKNIWILPGSSAETSFEGYNILGGILDEADSHKITRDKDYAEQGWNTINSRIDSRYDDKGFLLTVGQMKKANGFAARKYAELLADPENAHTVRMTIWESRGWDHYAKNPDGSRDSFWYDIKRKEIVPTAVVELMGKTDNLIEVPSVYRKNFENKPEQALRDLAGIPPLAGSAFISLTHKLQDAVDRWMENHPDLGSPVTDDPIRPVVEEWLVATEGLKRVFGLDIATAGGGDSAGLAMGHVSHLVDQDGEEKPYIVIDCMIRVSVPPGQEILISDLRRYIYDLKDNRGFRITLCTMDGHQSTDTRQQLRKRRIKPQYLSVDKSKLPYEDLRDAIYEDRIEWPPYMTYLKKGDTDRVMILNKELSELEENDRKVDHPTNGSKDVADAVAAVVNTLMGDRAYRRGVSSSDRHDLTDDNEAPPLETQSDGYSIGGHFFPGFGSTGMQAPIPPSFGSDLMSPIPPGLLPRRDSK